jgi:SAM-dependent methyltransferase
VPFLCPSCGAPLTVRASEHACSACPRHYPSCSTVPILVPDPERTLAVAQTFVRHGLGQIRKLRAAAFPSPWPTPAREWLRRRIVGGLQINEELLQRLASKLPPELLFEPESVAADSMYHTLDIVLRYAVRDWSGELHNEEQIVAIEQSITRDFPASFADSGRAVVLGAGTCRIAHDLTERFAHVLACDLSLPMLLTYVSICEANAKYVDINFVNTETAGGQVHEVTLSARRQESSTARPDRLTVAVCDATRLPLADESVDAAFSVYFTDVVGLATMLAEVHRVLAMGGILVHFGTLGYHQGRPSELLSVEDVREAVEKGGFCIESERWVSTRDIGCRPDRLVTVLLRNWQFVARKTVASTHALAKSTKARVEASK